jgi:hypothetical protein
VSAADDWPEPTIRRWRWIALYSSNAGYGHDLHLGRRLALRSRRATMRMWPRLIHGADENCNRAVTLVLWPLGSIDVWWEPKWRAEGMCESCKEWIENA